MSESLQALRKANPRSRRGFAASVEAAAETVRSHTAVPEAPSRVPSPRRRRALGVSVAGAAVAAATAAAVFLTIGSPGGGPGVQNATAALRKAATVTAGSARRSGAVDIRMTQDGQVWAHKVARWNGDDIELDDQSPRGASSGYPLLVVNGMLYGHDPAHEGWVEVGPVSSIDAGTGTTPTEQLDAIREDVGGETLRRITSGMKGLTATRLADGSTVYSGTFRAGLLAQETGFKEGQAIRVLPFGYVAHGAAADPDAPLDAKVTVGSDGLFRELAVMWAPAWTYTVTYSGLGTTPAIDAPAGALPLRRSR